MQAIHSHLAVCLLLTLIKIRLNFKIFVVRRVHSFALEMFSTDWVVPAFYFLYAQFDAILDQDS